MPPLSVLLALVASLAMHRSLVAAWIVAPWTWFLVRDLDSVLDIVALGLPAPCP